ncbi:MAG: hypothetical protein A2878_01330 [Candidatus Moranbacteria bacterium RIFCSPHIGHO2_01_FULL_54_31]|nr:MAG: hypothetical protein A2878_01330 [Candidatus Moranbacteria bacterium RIFCSPHIGHO2_01_FULL_54_31]
MPLYSKAIIFKFPQEFFGGCSTLFEEALSVRKKSCVPPSIGGDFFRSPRAASEAWSRDKRLLAGS